MLIRPSESMKTAIMFYETLLQRAKLPLAQFSKVLQLLHAIQTLVHCLEAYNLTPAAQELRKEGRKTVHLKKLNKG